MEEEDGNNISEAQNISLQITDEQFPQEKVIYSNFSDTKDELLKRKNSGLSDNTNRKKKPTEELSEINNNKKENIDEILNFVKASCTQITTSTEDISYDTIDVDDIMNIAEHGPSQNTVIQLNGHKKMFDSASHEMEPIDILHEPSNQILSDVVPTYYKASNKAGEIIKIGKTSSWLKETSSNNSTQQSIENLADKTGTQESAEPSLNLERMISSRSKSTKLEDHDILPTEPMVRDEDNSEPRLNRDQMILSWSLNEPMKLDHEVLSTESTVRDPDVSVGLLEDVPSKYTFPWTLIERIKLESREILPSMPVTKDPGISVDLLEAESSKGSIQFSDSLIVLDEKDKNASIGYDLVSDCLEQTQLNKPVPFCTRNDLSVEIGTRKDVESNENSNSFEKNSVQQEDVFNNLPDLQKKTNISSIIENFRVNNSPQKYRNEESIIEEMPPQSLSNMGFFGSPRTENVKQNSYAIQNANNFLNSCDSVSSGCLNRDGVGYPKSFKQITEQEKKDFPLTDQVSDNYKCTGLLLDMNFQRLSLSNEKPTSVKSSDQNSERHTNENPICSDNELIPIIECNSSENIQEVPSYDTNCNTSTATKRLNIDSKEIKDILDLEISSPQFPHEIEASFDINQEIDRIEIDSCIATMTTKDQQCKLDQNKEAININESEEQMEKISNEGKCHKTEINDYTLSVFSTDKMPELDKTTSSAPVVVKNNSSRLYKDSDKLANEASTAYQDSSFQPLREMANREPLTFITYSEEKSANNCEELLSATEPVGQNYEEEFSSNEENMKCKENYAISTTFLKQIEDIAYDRDEDSNTFPQQCEATCSTKHSSGRSNPNELSVKRSLLNPFTLGRKIPRYSSEPSTSIQGNNLIHEAILAFMENIGPQAFTLQDVVNFVIEDCSDNELIPIKCNSSENIQEVPSYDANCNTSTATKGLNIDSKEIKDILDLEILRPEFPHKMEASFDINQEVDRMEIDSCIATMTTKDQQCKLEQYKEAININESEEQMENISNEGKCHKTEITDYTLSVFSTDKIPELEKTASPAPIVAKITSSLLYKDSDKLANEVSTAYQDQPLTEMANGEPLTFMTYSEEKSANNCEELLSATALVDQNYEEEFLSNEENIECKENDDISTTFLKEIGDIAYDRDEDSNTFPEECEATCSTKHSSGRSNPNELSVKRSLLNPFTLGRKIPRYSCEPSTSIQGNNLIHEAILAFMESIGPQAFTLQDVVNFVMKELNNELSHFDAIHSARIFLRSALNAEMLKMNNGKYVIKSSVVRIT